MKDKLTQFDQILIPFSLYFDYFETINPLESVAGVQKLVVIYLSLSGCHPNLSSDIENI